MAGSAGPRCSCLHHVTGDWAPHGVLRAAGAAKPPRGGGWGGCAPAPRFVDVSASETQNRKGLSSWSPSGLQNRLEAAAPSLSLPGPLGSKVPDFSMEALV